MQSNAAPDLSDVSIVVLSHNRRDVLRRNLISLASLAEEHGCEVIVVDNASTDGSPQVIAEVLSGRSSMRFIANDTNLGVAGGRNTGWRVASRDYILNMDDDISVSANDVVRMAEVLRESGNFGIVAPRIADFNTGALQYSYGDERLEIANFQGACHMIRRSLAMQTGLNDEGCSFGGEELDLSIRIRAAGFKVIFTPEATALHDHKVRIGQDRRGRRERWLYNFVRVHHKHFPLHTALPFSLRYLVSHLDSGMRVDGPYFGARLLVAAVRGFRDGRRQHNAVPVAVVRFYRNPHLRPEFGNIPLWRKLGGKLGWHFATAPRTRTEKV